MDDNDWGPTFAKCLVNILEGEKKIELQRQILGSIPEFEPYAAFMRIDRDHKRYITLDDLSLFLKELNIRFSYQNLREVIRFYDKDKDECLNYEEFLKLVLTNSDYELRSYISQRRNYKVTKYDYLIYEIEDNLGLLILKELELIESILYKAESFILYNNRKYFEIFRYIDYLNYEYLEGRLLAMFLKKYGYYVTDSDINLLICRLDINCDGDVTLDDFKEIFSQPDDNLSYSIEEGNNSRLGKCDSTFHRTVRSPRITSRSPIRGSVSLRASLQSYSPPAREKPKKENIEGFSQISNRSFYSTNISDNKVDKHSIYSSKIKYESIITDYLIKLVTLENKLQGVKESFCLREFNIKRLFAIFDPYYKGYATIKDFQKGLDNLGIYTHLEDIRLLFKRYDTNKDGMLSFQEFTRMIAPFKTEYAKLLNNKFNTTSSFIKHERPSKEFSNLLKLLIETEYQMETYRKISTDNPYFIIADAFNVIKSENKMKNYFIKCDVYYTR